MFALLAGLEDFLGMIVPIVFFIYAIFQLLSSRNAPQGRNPQRRPPQPPERAVRPQQGAPPVKPAAGLNAEIEQLRRAGEQRERSLQPPVAPPPQKATPRQVMPPVRTLQSAPPPPKAARTSVAESVEQHLSTRDFADRADHLADEVIVAEAQLEQHVKEAFSHRVGTLDSSTSRPTAQVTDTAPSIATPLPASALVAMLSDRQSFRQAFILTEIIRRPVERW